MRCVTLPRALCEFKAELNYTQTLCLQVAGGTTPDLGNSPLLCIPKYQCCKQRNFMHH